MKPAPFRYLRASSVVEAVEALSSYGDDAKLLAGGQSLLPMMRFRLAAPTALVDIGRLDELRYLRTADDGLRIGALARHVDVEGAAGLGAPFDVLHRTAPLVGHLPIRTLGTWGGSVAHADPAGEWCLLMLLLDGEAVAVGPRGRYRAIPARELFTGFLSTSLEPEELVVELRLRRCVERAWLHEFSRRQGDFAVVAAAVGLTLEGERCVRARVALGGVASTPVRLPEVERMLQGEVLDEEAIAEASATAARTVDPHGDLHGSARYRRRLAETLVARSLRSCLTGGNGQARP